MNCGKEKSRSDGPDCETPRKRKKDKWPEIEHEPGYLVGSSREPVSKDGPHSDFEMEAMAMADSLSELTDKHEKEGAILITIGCEKVDDEWRVTMQTGVYAKEQGLAMMLAPLAESLEAKAQIFLSNSPELKQRIVEQHELMIHLAQESADDFFDTETLITE